MTHKKRVAAINTTFGYHKKTFTQKLVWNMREMSYTRVFRKASANLMDRSSAPHTAIRSVASIVMSLHKPNSIVRKWLTSICWKLKLLEAWWMVLVVWSSVELAFDNDNDAIRKLLLFCVLAANESTSSVNSEHITSAKWSNRLRDARFSVRMAISSRRVEHEKQFDSKNVGRTMAVQQTINHLICCQAQREHNSNHEK